MTSIPAVLVVVGEIAHGDGVLSLTASAKISVNGGDAHRSHAKGGGAVQVVPSDFRVVQLVVLAHWKPNSPLLCMRAVAGFDSTNSNLVLSGIDLSGYRPGNLLISGATATSSLDFSSGTLTFDTTHGYWHHTSRVHGTGVWNKGRRRYSI